jgi:hypothetical protein
MRRVGICFSVLVLCAVLAVIVMRWWVIDHLNFSQVGHTIQADPRNAAQMLETLARDIKDGTIPTRSIDLASVGAPDEEARLLGLRHLFQVFVIAFGGPPKSAADLKRLLTLRSLDSQQQEIVEEDSRKCLILAFPEDSYLLSCDGWRFQNPEDLQLLRQKFDSTTERFYLVGGHVFLYAPPSVARPFKQ